MAGCKPGQYSNIIIFYSYTVIHIILYNNNTYMRAHTTHTTSTACRTDIGFYGFTDGDVRLILRQTCDASIVANWSRQIGCPFVYMFARLSMAVYCCPWLSLAVYGCLWQSLAVFGCMWLSVASIPMKSLL